MGAYNGDLSDSVCFLKLSFSILKLSSSILKLSFSTRHLKMQANCEFLAVTKTSCVNGARSLLYDSLEVGSSVSRIPEII